MCEDTTAQAVAHLTEPVAEHLPGLTIVFRYLLEYMQKRKLNDIGLTRWGSDYADPMTDLDIMIINSSPTTQFSMELH